MKDSGPNVATLTGSSTESLAESLAEALAFQKQGIVSRVLARAPGGTVTLFAIDAGEGISEHTAPFDALALTLDGELAWTIGARRVAAATGVFVRLPAGVPHAVMATAPSRMLLMMLRA